MPNDPNDPSNTPKTPENQAEKGARNDPANDPQNPSPAPAVEPMSDETFNGLIKDFFSVSSPFSGTFPRKDGEG